MLVDNINYLRERNPYIREELKKIENNENKKFTIEETRSGYKTLLYKDDEKEVYFHSKYNPIRESESIIENYKDTKEQSIIFYGTGLGYHIDLLMSENPDNDYYIFEPIPELLEQFLSIRNLSNKEYKKLKKISLGLNKISDDIVDLIKTNRKEVHIIELPTHKQVFEDESREFNEIFRKIVKLEKSDTLTNYGFQKRWIINTMKNFKEVLSTPNILIEKSGKFKDKPVILVAAGPSLNEEIENIRYIKENGLAYIVSVGSAINTLIYHNIHPDAATTYDPGVYNHNVFKKVKEKNIKDIPMIFGSSVSFETLENYPGKMYHMITTQDPTSSYYLKSKDNQDIDLVQDASTISVVTIQLLNQLGFNPIILVGQNLGYVGKKNHSEGVDYSMELTGEQINSALKIKDVYGKEILTNLGYNSMRNQIELYIKLLKDKKVINTTKGGASIEGAEFIELEKVIESDLKENIVDKDWLKSNKTNYDKEYLEEKLKLMDKSHKEALKITRRFIDVIRSINKEIKNERISKIENLYVKLDKEIRKMEKNDFYTHFLMPMNRVQYRIVAENVQNLNQTKDSYDKASVIVNSYGGLISVLNDDLYILEPIYKKMKESIERYIEGEVN